MLMNQRDAGLLGVGRRTHRDPLARYINVAEIRFDRAAQHLDQRRLAGTVLANDAHDLAREDGKRNVVIGAQLTVGLGQSARL